jgi:hypothetical protein
MVLSGHMLYAYSEGSEVAVASIHRAAEKRYSRKLRGDVGMKRAGAGPAALFYSVQ